MAKLRRRIPVRPAGPRPRHPEGAATSVTLASVPDGFDALVAADLARGLVRHARGPGRPGPCRARRPAPAGVRERARASSRPRSRCCASRPGTASPTTASRRTRAVTAQRMTALARLARSRTLGGAAAHPLDHRQRARAARAAARRDRGRDASRPRPATSSTMDALVALARDQRLHAQRHRARGRRIRRARRHPRPLRAGPAAARSGSTSSATRSRSIRAFDPETQRTTGQLRALDLVPMSEVQLTTESDQPLPAGLRRRLRRADAATTASTRRSARAAAIPGMEHWLPLFHERLDTLFDYVPGRARRSSTRWSTTRPASGSRRSRTTTTPAPRRPEQAEVGDALQAAAAGRALSRPDRMGDSASRELPLARLTPFAQAAGDGRPVHRSRARGAAATSPPSAPTRTPTSSRPPSSTSARCRPTGGASSSRAWSEGSRERLGHVLDDHGLTATKPVASSPRRWRCRQATVALAVWGFEAGLRDRPTSPSSASRTSSATGSCARSAPRKRPQDFLAEVAALTPGDLVVHVDHGIGRFVGLKTIEAAGAPHDCLELALCRRRPALPAGREHRAPVPLRLGGDGGPARQARRRRLAGAQGQAEAAHPRDGGRSSSRSRPPRILKEAPKLRAAGRRSTTSSRRASPTRRPRTS